MFAVGEEEPSASNSEALEVGMLAGAHALCRMVGWSDPMGSGEHVAAWGDRRDGLLPWQT